MFVFTRKKNHITVTYQHVKNHSPPYTGKTETQVKNRGQVIKVKNRGIYDQVVNIGHDHRPKATDLGSCLYNHLKC